MAGVCFALESTSEDKKPSSSWSSFFFSKRPKIARVVVVVVAVCRRRCRLDFNRLEEDGRATREEDALLHEIDADGCIFARIIAIRGR
jgi:hypothetical protein